MKVPKTIWLLALVQLTLSLNSPLEAIKPFEAIRSLSSSSQTSLADDVAKNDDLTHGQDVEHDFVGEPRVCLQHILTALKATPTSLSPWTGK